MPFRTRVPLQWATAIITGSMAVVWLTASATAAGPPGDATVPGGFSALVTASSVVSTTSPAATPGWRKIFSDDFTGAGVNLKAWGLYRGQPGGDPGGWWDPSHVFLRNGKLVLSSYRDPVFGKRWVSGGLSNTTVDQTYGKYLARFRVDKGKGIGYAMLLWPSSERWPPEIDFGEDGGGDRQHTTATLHYGAGNSQIQKKVTADFTRWHTLGVEWLPGSLRYTLDGAVWATVSSSSVPSVPMEFDMQTQAGTCGNVDTPCPDKTTPQTVDLEVDWVAVYART